MNKIDEKRFVQIMLGMADNFRDNITKEGMAMRFDMLKKHNISQIEAAAKQIMVTRKYTKMPPVAEFIELLEGGNIEDRALTIANKIIEHSRVMGADEPLKINDPVAQELMRNRWPYQQWASTVLESELKWWVKEFCESYKSLEAVGVQKEIEAPESIKKLLNIGRG